MTHRFKLPPLPREHGSWAMFFVPMILGIGAAGIVNINVALFVISAFGFFLVRYPLMLAIKSRDVTARTDAVLWSAVYGAVSVISGGVLLGFLSEWRLVLFAILGILSLGIYLGLAFRRAEMSVVGEWMGIAGVALGAPGVYWVGTRTLDVTALLLYLLNVLYFGGTVFYIKFKVREQMRTVSPDATWHNKLWAGRLTLAYHAMVFIVVVALTIIRCTPMLVAVAFLLPMCKTFAGVLMRPSKLNIPRLGFIELGITAAFALVMMLAFR